MATEQTATEPTAAATPATETQATPAAPSSPPGLAEAVADYQGHRARAMGKGDAPAKPAEASAETPAKEPEKAAEAAQAKEPDKPAAEPEKEPAKEPKADEVPEAMVKILRQTRALERQRREASAVREEAEAKLAEAERVRAEHAKAIEAAQRFEAARKKDPVAAVEELIGKEAMGGTFALDLINRMAEKEEGAAPTAEQIADAAAEKAEASIRAKMAEEQSAKEAEAAKAREQAEKDRAADIEQKKTAFFTGLATQLKADAEKYPYLIAKPVDWEDVDSFIVTTFTKTGAPPTPEAILKHFDSEREKDAVALAAVLAKRKPAPAAAEPAKKLSPTAKVASDDSRDTKGRPEVPPKGETQRERLERVARELNASFGH